jgi:hypothetical protein
MLVSVTLDTLTLTMPTLTPHHPHPPPPLHRPQPHLPPPLHLPSPTSLRPQPSQPDVSSTMTTTTAKARLPLLLRLLRPSRPVIATPTPMEVSQKYLDHWISADSSSCSLRMRRLRAISS